MRLPSFVRVCLLALPLAACGGGQDQAQLAATACEIAAKDRLEGKSYSLDLEALAASMKAQSDGSQKLVAPIVVEPGLATESKQAMECTVRFVAGNAKPDVIGIVFNW